MKYATLVLGAAILLALLDISHAEDRQVTFRDGSGQTTGTATTNANGTTTFRDASGRTTGTANTNANGITTFRNANGQTTGTATRSR